MTTLFVLLCFMIVGMNLFSIPNEDDNISKALWIVNSLILIYIAFTKMIPAFSLTYLS